MKKIVALLLALIMGFSLVACSPKVDNNDDVSGKKTASSKKSAKGDDEGEDNVVSSGKGESVSSKTTTTSGKVSANWEDFEFSLDGKKYSLPFPYKDFVSDGWDYDKSQYGHKDGFILNPNQKATGGIALENNKFSNKATLLITHKNNGNKAADIAECDVASVSYGCLYAIKNKEKYPDFEIAKGIKIGSRAKEIEVAFGKPENIYKATDSKYSVYTYNSADYSKYLNLFVYDEYGLTEVSMQEYK